jgi:hypothetical protein
MCELEFVNLSFVIKRCLINMYRMNFIEIIQLRRNSVRTSQRTHFLSVRRTNGLELLTEVTDLYCENNKDKYNVSLLEETIRATTTSL